MDLNKILNAFSGYMAPEYIVHGQLTEKADIYSYGVLVLEIVTGRKNHSSISESAGGHSLVSLVITSLFQYLFDQKLPSPCSNLHSCGQFFFFFGLFVDMAKF